MDKNMMSVMNSCRLFSNMCVCGGDGLGCFILMDGWKEGGAVDQIGNCHVRFVL